MSISSWDLDRAAREVREGLTHAGTEIGMGLTHVAEGLKAIAEAIENKTQGGEDHGK